MKPLMFWVISSVTVIIGLAVVHFSLANAQPGPFPFAVHEGGATPTPTFTPTPTPLPDVSISPSSGSVGTLIQISGSNFASNESVSITFNNQQIATGGASTPPHPANP